MRAIAGEDFVTGFGYEDVVFDSDSELAGHVYAGFDCKNLAGFELALAVGFEEWIFVDLKAESVPCAVGVNGQAGLVNDLPGGGIDLGDFHAGLDCFYRRGLGLLYDVVNLLVESCHAADDETSGNVAAIAFIFCADIDQDSIFFL